MPPLPCPPVVQVREHTTPPDVGLPLCLQLMHPTKNNKPKSSVTQRSINGPGINLWPGEGEESFKLKAHTELTLQHDFEAKIAAQMEQAHGHHWTAHVPTPSSCQALATAQDDKVEVDR